MTGATDDRGRATAGRGVPLSTADRSQNATDAQSCRMVRPAYKIKVNKLTVSALPSTSYIRPDETRELLDLTFHVSSHSVFLHLNQSLCIVRGCQNLAASARARPSSSCSRLRARSHTVSRKVRWRMVPRRVKILFDDLVAILIPSHARWERARRRWQHCILLPTRRACRDGPVTAVPCPSQGCCAIGATISGGALSMALADRLPAVTDFGQRGACRPRLFEFKLGTVAPCTIVMCCEGLPAALRNGTVVWTSRRSLRKDSATVLRGAAPRLSRLQ